MLRAPDDHEAWRSIHYASYVGWADRASSTASGIGTDLRDPSAWATWATLPALASSASSSAPSPCGSRGRRDPPLPGRAAATGTRPVALRCAR